MNLATVARSPIGRHVLIYTFGASALAVLRQARGVIEGGFQLLDHLAHTPPALPVDDDPVDELPTSADLELERELGDLVDQQQQPAPPPPPPTPPAA